jgi:hypothetical protein
MYNRTKNEHERVAPKLLDALRLASVRLGARGGAQRVQSRLSFVSIDRVTRYLVVGGRLVRSRPADTNNDRKRD